MEGKDNENSADLRNHNPITTTKAGRQLILYHLWAQVRREGGYLFSLLSPSS
jgi:hypothetical protein